MGFETNEKKVIYKDIIELCYKLSFKEKKIRI